MFFSLTVVWFHSSILNQTYLHFEIIVVNDGSRDSSANICNRYAKKDSRIKVVHKKNKGVSSARNLGLDISRGRYIMFIDSDDWVEPEMIDHLVQVQKEHNVDIIMFGTYEDDLIRRETHIIKYKEDKQLNKEDLIKLIPTWVKNERINTVYTKMYKASMIKNNKIRFDEALNIGEDALFNYRVYFQTETIFLTTKCFYHYMIRDTKSLSKRLNPNKYEMLTHVNDTLIALIHNNEAYKGLLPSADYIRIKNICSCLIDIFKYHSSKSYKIKRKMVRDIVMIGNKKHNYRTNNFFYDILAYILVSKNVTLVYFLCFTFYNISKFITYFNKFR